MKKLNVLSAGKYLLLFLAGTFLLSSCDEMPDLTVTADYSISGDQYEIKLSIKNIGDAESGKALVYINYINPTPPTGMNEIRIQKSEELPVIAAGGEYSFIKTIPLSDIHAKEIEKIEVFVDSKNTVKESNEDNNKETWDWDSGL